MADDELSHTNEPLGCGKDEQSFLENLLVAINICTGLRNAILCLLENAPQWLLKEGVTEVEVNPDDIQNACEAHDAIKHEELFVKGVRFSKKSQGRQLYARRDTPVKVDVKKLRPMCEIKPDGSVWLKKHTLADACEQTTNWQALNAPAHVMHWADADAQLPGDPDLPPRFGGAPMLMYMRRIGRAEMAVLRNLKLMRAPTPGHEDSIEKFWASLRHKMLAWNLKYVTYDGAAAIVLKQQGDSQDSFEQGLHQNYLPRARKRQQKSKKRPRTQHALGEYLDIATDTDDDAAI